MRGRRRPPPRPSPEAGARSRASRRCLPVGRSSAAPSSALLKALPPPPEGRRLGGALPGEHSEEGRLMEAEAATVERSVATDTELPLARIAAPGVQAAPNVQASPSAQGARSAQASTVVIEARAPWATYDTMQRAPERGVSPAV